MNRGARPAGGLAGKGSQTIKEKVSSAAGLSQEALVDRCGFARSYMSRIERGRGNRSLDAIETLAGGLRVSVIKLFED